MGTFQDDHECIISPLKLSRCYFWLVRRCIKIIPLEVQLGACAHACVCVYVCVGGVLVCVCVVCVCECVSICSKRGDVKAPSGIEG